jgi:hypothetical protein
VRHLGSRASVMMGWAAVEVTGPVMVLRARRLAWSPELALTSLVARLCVSPFGRLPWSLALPRLRPPFSSLDKETVMTPRRQKMVES